MPRNTTIRDRHRKAIARDEPPCGICGGPIDYTIQDHLNPWAYVVDHITPLDAGGPDTLDNKQAAHRTCNRAKSNHTPGEHNTGDIRTFETARSW